MPNIDKERFSTNQNHELFYFRLSEIFWMNQKFDQKSVKNLYSGFDQPLRMEFS